MKRSTLRRTGGIAAAALTLSMGLAACGSSSSSTASGDGDTSAATGNTFGAACSQLPASGAAGSLTTMADEPVATAASGNPLLSTLVKAVGAVPGLADTLNTAPALTVFAPDNDAFAAVPAASLKKLLANPTALGALLSYHVIGSNLDPTDVVGTQKSLAGGTVTVSGDTSGMMVNGTANVLCGGIQTKNATVYVIDSVLTPPAS